MATSAVELAVEILEILVAAFVLFEGICIMVPPRYRWFAIYTTVVVLLILWYPPFALI